MEITAANTNHLICCRSTPRARRKRSTSATPDAANAVTNRQNPIANMGHVGRLGAVSGL